MTVLIIPVVILMIWKDLTLFLSLLLKKFKLFGETLETKIELEKFKNNLEMVQAYLGQLESSLFDSEDRLEYYEEKLLKINSLLNSLQKDLHIDQNTHHSLQTSLIFTEPKSRAALISNETVLTAGTIDTCYATCFGKLDGDQIYFEVNIDLQNGCGGHQRVGVAQVDFNVELLMGNVPNSVAYMSGYLYGGDTNDGRTLDGDKWNNNDRIGVYFDRNDGRVRFYRNNVFVAQFDLDSKVKNLSNWSPIFFFVWGF